MISHLPSQLHISLLSITREKYPNPRDRSRLFEAFLKDLISWWYQVFTVLPGKELKRKGIQEVEEELKGWKEELERLRRKEKKGKGKEKQVDQDQPSQVQDSKYKDYPWEEEQLSYEKRKKRLNAQQKQSQKEPIASTSSSSFSSFVRPYESSPTTWEPVASINSLYAAAASLKGSKDLSTQLFVALLRGLDVPARLVISLQGMEWRSDSASGLTKKEPKISGKSGKSGRGRGRGRGGGTAAKGKGKGKQVETIELSSSESEKEEEEDDGNWQDGRGKLNYKVPKPNLRRSGSSQQQKMAAWKKEKMMMRSPSPGEFTHS